MHLSIRFRRCYLPIAVVTLFSSFFNGPDRLSAAEKPSPRVREPAVAGLFYPKDPAELAKIVEACLAQAEMQPGFELKALVCPHAGYVYSGPIAASGFRQAAGRDYTTVVVMGPSHYASLRGASITNADFWRTPLGDVQISEKARILAKLPPFAMEPECHVERPSWWRQSSRSAPAQDTADTWEHSVEVEIPFLQKTLKSFSLVPVVVGSLPPRDAARALLQIVDDKTLIVASSDLSHYDTYENARTRDRRCVDAICALDGDSIEPEDACGARPIQVLIEIARMKGWHGRILDLRSSGDTAGDKAHVVGYAAIAFYASAGEHHAPAPQYSAADRKLLLDLARRTVGSVVTTRRLPELTPGTITSMCAESRGCFVTLTEAGELRGCIGNIIARGPLYKAVMDNARSAALEDPRFPAVTERELDRIEIEISVLTPPQPLAFSSPDDLLKRLRPHEDGVVLQIGSRSATYLPQVWEQLPDKVQFLNHLAEKAGCDPDDWRGSGTKVFIYRVEAFKESDPAR